MLFLKWAVCAAVLSEMAVTPKLWLTVRGFPTVPVLAGFPELPQVLCLILTWIFIASTVFVAVHPKPRFGLFVPPAVGLLLVIFDVDRLQPWFYQYLLMLVALGVTEWNDSDHPRSRAAWGACGFVVAAIYVYSGIQKANMTFATDVFPWLFQPLGNSFVENLHSYWFLVPILEASIDILLILPRTRAFGLAGALVMHSSLLFLLGPFGHNYNSSVWPWNFWMLVMAFILFFRNDRSLIRLAWARPTTRAIAVLVGIFPALNFVDCWDGFLSGSYYSGRLRDGWIYFSDVGAERLPAQYSTGNSALTQDSTGNYRMDITQWAIATMNVPPYAEPRVYDAILGKLERAGVPRDEMVMYVRERSSLTVPAKAFAIVP
jgi:hypothetical protein